LKSTKPGEETHRAFLFAEKNKAMRRTLQKSLVIIGTLLTTVFMQPTFAEQNATHIGRYLDVPNAPLSSQANLLNQTFQVRFPTSVITIDDAMRYLLRFSGYSLVAENSLMPETKHLLNLPLPQTDRMLGPLTLQQGLLTLAGQPFGLLVDPVHRLISFRLLPRYQSIYQKPNSFML
jgi:conjugative transfer region protein (TIGR03748 family)